MDRTSPQAREPQRGETLASLDADGWFQLVLSVGPPAMIVVIESWLDHDLKASTSAEDIWQETLLDAWRLRAEFTWNGGRAFRSWLLMIARSRISHTRADKGRKKRGGDHKIIHASALESEDGPMYAGPVQSTTPSQAARDAEIAQAMGRALGKLSDSLREVVLLCLFEDQRVEEVAERCGLGPSGVRHRLRKGLDLYRRHLLDEMGDVEESDYSRHIRS